MGYQWDELDAKVDSTGIINPTTMLKATLDIDEGHARRCI